ncbi:hypothetical protein BVRB_6g136530 [Beta vulgaris subsp. vulgaris]|nr:hypothetical protein BVRB_6g136530 [Beta vulgaris subsp. vulgaris]
MLPAFLKNVYRINEVIIELMERSELTFHFKGPWFSNVNLLVSVDPANINHVLSKHFEDYVKGPKLYEILSEALGDGIIVTDSTVWLYHRNVAHSFFSHPNFHQYLVDVTWKKVKNGLIPVFDHVSKHKIEIDLQELFLRFGYDTMCTIMMDHDPTSLSVDSPDFPLLKAVADLEHGALMRHVLPTWIWKLQRWLNVGYEKKFRQGLRILDDFIYRCIDRKREANAKGASSNPKDDQDFEVSFDLLTFFMDNEDKNTNDDKFLRDTITNFFLAGGETTSTALSWFFYLLSNNPRVFHKIKEELNSIMTLNDDIEDKILRNFKELSSKLVYLHAALCETLRLYPSVQFNPKTPVEPQILPSGHRVNPNTEILFDLHAMGRMKSIWGDDCNEFKPERWISKEGMIKHEPSYKFSVFSAGPRSCIGKQMAFTQMKIIVAAVIIQNYHIKGVEKYHVPTASMVLRMKHGFKVKIFRS